MTITLTLEEAQQVLDALEHAQATEPIWKTPIRQTKETLRARLSAPEPEPVAWMWDIYNGAGYSSRGIGFQQTDIPFAKHAPLYTAPPQRKEWQGLTDEEIVAIVAHPDNIGMKTYRAIEAKLKEKNT